MKRDQFNKAIADSLAPNDDDELRNSVATTFGKRFVGLVEDTNKAHGPCAICGSDKNVATRRLNTSYADDKSNWMTSCKTCFEETVHHYQELWDDFYASRW